jgi:DNA repair exonuclease SbcCD ATPase subunit
MDWTAIITSLVSLVIGTILGPIILYRYQKPKRERDAEQQAREEDEQAEKRDKDAALAHVYLNLNEMTAKQLEVRINQVGILVTENLAIKQELAEIKARQAARDEQEEARDAHMAALQEQVNKDAKERSDLNGKLAQFETRNRALWQYLVALLEHMKKHNVEPLDPPAALKSDPDIMRILGRGNK